jgi:hypothetical protein
MREAVEAPADSGQGQHSCAQEVIEPASLPDEVLENTARNSRRGSEMLPMVSASDGFVPGQRVRIVGISRPDLEGRRGLLVHWVEQQACWRVRMNEGPMKLIKQHSLEVVEVDCN